MQLPNRDPAPNHRLRSLGAQSVHCTACSATQKYTHTENAQLHKYTNAQEHKSFPIESWRQRIGCAPSWVGTPAMPYLGAPQPYPGALQPCTQSPPLMLLPYITLYPCPASPYLVPLGQERRIEGSAPEITMLAQCRNGARSQCFSMGRQNRVGGKNKQWTGTLKAQSVHRRWRKVSFNNGVRKLFLQKLGAANWTTLSDKYIIP